MGDRSVQSELVPVQPCRTFWVKVGSRCGLASFGMTSGAIGGMWLAVASVSSLERSELTCSCMADNSPSPSLWLHYRFCGHSRSEFGPNPASIVDRVFHRLPFCFYNAMMSFSTLFKRIRPLTNTEPPLAQS